MKNFLMVCVSGWMSLNLLIAHQPNPPVWPPSSVDSGGVFVFEPGDPDAQKTINDIYTINGGINQNDNGQFSANRYALLFKPGTYPNLSVPVGYYTSVIGLGNQPGDTNIFEVVCYESNYNQTVGALNTFWRSAENFTMTPNKSYWPTGPICMLWATSQASPLRRVQLNGANGNLSLYQYVPPFPGAGYSSGGFIANSSVNGTIDAGSQQQYLARNVAMNNWINGIWNFVFVGCLGAPNSSCGSVTPLTPFTNVAETPVIAEKPYMVINQKGLYSLVIPGVEFNKVGPSFSELNVPTTTVVDFKYVYVAAPSDPVSKINRMIERGYHIILTPGIYYLNESINVNTDKTCILGIGYPTLVANNGKPCIKVGATNGVRIAGILLQAGPNPTSTLLRWGKKNRCCSQSDSSESFEYGFLYDCFARVGGPTNSRICPVTADVMVEINSDHVVGDNCWLWRADHDVGGIVVDRDNPCDTALVVNGDDVTLYGIAAEHTLKDILQWNGNNGRLYFYESEYPYDVDQENYGNKGYSAYHVKKNVKSHQAWGVAVYSFFRDFEVVVQSGIKTPRGSNIHFVNSLTRWLNGFGGILHVVNKRGDTVDADSPGPAYLCEF